MSRQVCMGNGERLGNKGGLVSESSIAGSGGWGEQGCSVVMGSCVGDMTSYEVIISALQ